MASAKATIDLPIPPDKVWNLIGGFGSLPEWLPFIRKSDLTRGGRLRHLQDPEGHPIVEQLERYDNAARTYSYSIVESPFPVVNYLATITVSLAEVGRGAHVEWAGTFTSNGASDAEVHTLFQGIFSDGLKALSEHYEAAR